MDRSASNPIPNSWREEGEENSQRKRRGGVEISRLTIKTCLQGLKKKLC